MAVPLWRIIHVKFTVTETLMPMTSLLEHFAEWRSINFIMPITVVLVVAHLTHILQLLHVIHSRTVTFTTVRCIVTTSAWTAWENILKIIWRNVIIWRFYVKVLRCCDRVYCKAAVKLFMFYVLWHAFCFQYRI